MGEIETRLDRLESLVEQQQETIRRQRERIADLESNSGTGEQTPGTTRRDVMKTAGLVGLLGAGTGAAAAGPTIGEPGNQVETLYAQGLAGDLTGGTAVTDLVGAGLRINDGSLNPSLSSDLMLSDGDIAVDVGPGDVGAAPDSHGNEAHSSDFATSGEVPTNPGDIGAASDSHGNEAHSTNFAASSDVPSSPGDIGAASNNHGNEAHSETYAVDGDAQPPETHGNGAHSTNFAASSDVPTSPSDIGAASNNHGNEAHSINFAASSDVPSNPGDIGAAPDNHGNEAHSETYAVDGDAQPPETHGNGAHSTNFAASSDVPSSPGDIGAASNNHGNEAHSSDFATSGEVPSNPGDIGAASDNHGNGAHSTTFISSLSGGTGIAQSSLGDGDTVSVDWSDANDLDSSGNVSGPGVSGGRYISTNGDQVDFSPPAEWNTAGSNNNSIAEQDAENSVICGGENNEIVVDGRTETGFIGAGSFNSIGGGSGFGKDDSGIVAGFSNTLYAPWSVIGAGTSNVINEWRSGILAGQQNAVDGQRAAVVAGENNTASGDDEVITSDGTKLVGCSTVVGGYDNRTDATCAGVLNGVNNRAAGVASTVPGGQDNEARGDFSLAAGNSATATADGAVVLGDATDEPFAPEGPGLHTQMETYTPEVNRVVSEGIDTDQLAAETALDRLTGVDIGTSETGDGLRIDAEAFNDAFDLDGEELGTLDVEAALLGAVQALAERLDRVSRA